MKIRALMLLVTLLGLSLAVSAQTSRGTVSGTVTDPTGAVIAGANVTLINIETTVERSTVSNDEGFYRFDAVDPGQYSVKFSSSGFGEVIKTNIPVLASRTAEVSTSMAPGGQQVTVDVTAEATALLQTEAAVRGGNIETRRVQELPYAGRNPVSLALTLPGVSSNRGGAGASTFSVNGARARSNNFLIDGTENNDISVAGQGFQITNPDAVQEVSVQTGIYDAEFGRSGGGVINTVTKGGTNDFHGTVHFLYDSTYDDALTSQQSRVALNLAPKSQGGRGGHPPSGTEFYAGGTIGGPVIIPKLYDGHNRTFFFFSGQQQDQRSTGESTIFAFTAAGRERLRQLFPAGTNANLDLYMGLTSATVGVADPFNIDITPRTGCGTFATPGVANSYVPCNVQVGTFTRNLPVTFLERQFQIRIDHKISDNDQLSGRLLTARGAQPFGGTLGTATFEGFDADYSQRFYNFLVSETHVFNPTLTNELRLAYNRIQLGFPLSDPEGQAGTLPRIEFNGLTLSFLGADTTFPQGRTANNYVIQDTVTKIHGDHTFRFGADFLRQISTQSAPSIPRGLLTYSSSSGTDLVPSGYNSFANFLDNFGGTAGAATRDIGSPKYFPQLYRVALFFQDRWKATEALTLTLGVRYENFGTPFNALRTPAFAGLFNVDPVTRTGPFSVPNSVHHDQNNFAPVFGFAYSPAFESGFMNRLFGNKETVFRGGFQIGYDSFYNNIASNAQSSSPNLIRTTVTSNAAAGVRGISNFSSQLPSTAATLSAASSQTLIDPNLVNPYYMRWSVGLQRSLPWNLIVDMSYVGSRGVKLFVTEDLNPTVPPALRITPPGAVGGLQNRLDNLQGIRNIRTNGGSSIYHSGQLEVTRRFADNFTITGSYTWSKLIDNFSDPFAQTGTTAGATFAYPSIAAGLPGLPAGYGQRLDRAVALFDRPHRASITYVYSVPYFREQRGVLGHLLGGFQIAGVTTFESGYPFTVFNSFDADGISGGLDRPTYNPLGQRGVRAIPVTDANGNITGYTNPDSDTPSALIDPLTAEFIVNPAYVPTLSGSRQRFGNLGRNTERTPGTNNFNVNITKRTKISERMNVEFRTEFYNIFNHPQYIQGSVSPFSPGGGTLSSNAFSAAKGRFLNPNTPTSDGGGRVIRYQIKFIF
ncbi:MAG TPA: carboxypeptidase regulatory-like domain-containing protein [Pyrinomonadaceae bacterium]|jgi:outer membrane receptor protein involved in Fe transport